MRLGLGNTLAITNKVGDNPFVPPTLGWQSSVLVSSTDDSIVSTEGALKEAYRFGPSAGDLTLNNVPFVWTDYGSTTTLNELFSSVGSSTASMQALLRGLSFSIPSNTVSLVDFIVGSKYMLQWFFSDERTGGSPTIQTRTQTISIDGYTNTFPFPLTAKATKCYFIASTASIDIVVGANGEPEAGHIEAFQIRKIT